MTFRHLHPTQQLIIDKDNVIRFRKNSLIEELVNRDIGFINQCFIKVAEGSATPEDLLQLLQVLGFSVDGIQGVVKLPPEVETKVNAESLELLSYLANARPRSLLKNIVNVGTPEDPQWLCVTTPEQPTIDLTNSTPNQELAS